MKFRIFILSIVLMSNATCSFWYNDKLVTCEYEVNQHVFHIKGCDSSDV